MRAELSVSEICRKYSISDAQFYKWNKEFLEVGKKRLAGDLTREATSDEVAEIKVSRCAGLCRGLAPHLQQGRGSGQRDRLPKESPTLRQTHPC